MSKKVRKRDGRLANFDKHRIVSAIRRAVESTDGETWDEYFQTKADNIANYIENEVEKSDDVVNIEHVQDLVENGLMDGKRGKDVARNYIIYRNDRNMSRKNTIDNTIRGIVGNKSPYWTSENANKNPRLNTTQRDYIAGAVSTDAVNRWMIPQDLVKAHQEGICHWHDADYSIQPMTNCCLINLDDMLQNGTVISETLIEKPKSFRTACTVTTQIIAQVASSQYGQR